MAWTSPAVITAGQSINAAFLNARVRDNLDFIKDLSGDHAEGTGAAHYTTTSTSFVSVSSDFDLALTTHGLPVLLMFTCTMTASAADYLYMDIAIDSTRLGGANGLTGMYIDTAYFYMIYTFWHLETGLSASAHTFEIMWRTAAGGTMILRSLDLYPQFAVKEMT